MTDARPFAVPLLVGLLCVILSTSWYAIRFGLQDQPPLYAAAVRFLVAGLAMAAVTPWLRARENAPPPPARLWLAAGSLSFAGSYGILYVAETVVPSGIAAVLWAVFPLLMAGSAVCFLGERLRARQVLGFVVSFAGIVAVCSGDLGGIGREQLPWALLLLLSPVVSAAGTTLVKRYGSRTSSVVLNRNGMLTGAALLSVAAFVREDPLAVVWTWRAVVATGYLALGATALAFGVYFWLLRAAPASMLSLISYVTPVLAMLFGAAVGDGTIDGPAWFGSGLVVLGVVFVVWPAGART
jgi:drug/metabolite transporter (DMT)-like permease